MSMRETINHFKERVGDAADRAGYTFRGIFASSNVMKKHEGRLKEILGPGALLYHVDHRNVPINSWEGEGHYELQLPDGEGRWWAVASFQMSQLPGCCGVCVSHGASINHAYRGKGLGTILNRLRIDLARQAGYGLLICTDLRDNLNQRRVLKVNGWMDICKFINPRTNNKILISSVHL